MAKKPTIEVARDKFREQQDKLNTIPIELQVRDLEHATSPEVINFSISHLTNGGRWDELRRKLGLGQAHKDWRWRKLREVLANGLIPQSEQEALKAQADRRAYLLGKLEEFGDDLEGVLQTLTSSTGDKIGLQHMLKLKLEVIKTQLQENEKEYMAFIETKKLKAEDKKNRGVSVIIQNNYHIPRPGEDATDVTASVTQLIEKKAEA